jgi:WhiB family transcriptional regulator, redox-sensing transcriptional regulator
MNPTDSVPASSLAGGGRGEAPADAGAAYLMQTSALYRAGPHPGNDVEDLPCHHEDPELFFGPDKAKGWQSYPAKAVCRRCPIVDECREWAISAGPYLHGVYGATTRTERDAIRAARRKETAGG